MCKQRPKDEGRAAVLLCADRCQYCQCIISCGLGHSGPAPHSSCNACTAAAAVELFERSNPFAVMDLGSEEHVGYSVLI